MAQRVTIVAEMAGGGCIVEHVAAFEDFTGIVLGFRRDSECRRLTWQSTPALAAETLDESSGDCPWNQSQDLEWEAAQVAAERREWSQAMAADDWARFVADMVDQQRAEDAAEGLRQAGCWPVRTLPAEVA